ncbi:MULTISPECIES: DNA/RNA non-specific endonuclease [unclassified Lactococcus]|uniref:DNA/RNA non-specific endonuclease n=1 Tax=unclassified Lactococcus TaxID=2643510 RepID=UPI0011C85710|nr:MULTISPECIES: DNA/RNA non-specific endonuclease [unclassified Lactococcus]MQW23106.1 deoxyribonuclease [Lactococcus sp. dk101]TXK44161.1 deoxyribonuclease [Lactococcus sp. dk310]TXK49892.1 deoxyribonuclease [Lactococcus sp. dk322]
MKKILIWGTSLLAALTLTACSSTENTSSSQSSSSVESSISQSSTSSTSQSSTSSTSQSSTASQASITANQATILSQLVQYTNAESAGPTKNYYYENGKAKLSSFENLSAGQTKFVSDAQGRSATARAVLTYAQFEASKGSRQGEPLDPPYWPSNQKVAISYALTGRTYHGYLWNRSHSIADSLLGNASYTSPYNFTTGTRSQNVGANQDGGMRFAEETVENYWKAHPNTSVTVQYQTTPLYQGSEKIPRGSLVDIKSSDGVLDTEIVVINSAEGNKIDYTSGSNKATAQSSVKASSSSSSQTAAAAPAQKSTTTASTGQATTSDGWTTAASGMVYVSKSDRYYRSVLNPGNYRYLTLAEAQNAGAVEGRSNGYARN